MGTRHKNLIYGKDAIKYAKERKDQGEEIQLYQMFKFGFERLISLPDARDNLKNIYCVKE